MIVVICKLPVNGRFDDVRNIVVENFAMLQANHDPAFLPLGTEVSAKYKGAFCEAKVKKIVKTLKIKVLLYLQFC